jgi:hypothetical protein
MNHELENLTKQAADLIPKGGAYIYLKNIELAIKIVFDTIAKLIQLVLVLALIYIAYRAFPALETLLKIQ